MLNLIVLTGRLTKDVEYKATQNGKSFGTFTLAVQRNYKNADGNYDADFINCVTSSPLMQYVKKGDLVTVSGELTTRKYEDRNGATQTAYSVRVGQVYLQPNNRSATQQSAGANTPASNPFTAQYSNPFTTSIDIDEEDLAF